MFENPEIFIPVIIGVAGLLALGWKFLKSKWTWANKLLAKTQLDELAEAAAAETYETFVRDLKANAKDGKLTSEEKKEAMKRAVGTFKDLAKDQAIPAAKELALPMIKALIEKGINRLKGDAADAKAPPAEE